MKRILLLILSMQMAYGSLSSLHKHAASLPEVPEVSYATFALYPDYSQWHRDNQPSLLIQLLTSVGLYRPTWSPTYLSKELAQVTKQRQGLTSHTLYLQPKPETEVIIVGPLYGSYHSLLRILTELKYKQLLTDQLQLTKKTSFLVFTGDTINGSPYNLETLSLILRLMAANPEQVIYLAGEQEQDDTWRGLGVMNDLNERIGVPGIEDQISSLFDSLPKNLIITDGTDALMVGSGIPTSCPLKQLTKGVPTVCPTTNQAPSVTAVITSEKRLMSYAQHGGLVQAPAQLGALTWTIFSGPNRAYRKYYDFTYDAFAILTIGTSLAQSTIALYNQDVIQKPGFSKVARYAVLSGKDLSSHLTSDNPFIPSATTLNKLTECKNSSDLSFAEGEAADKKEPLYIGCTLDLTKGASPLGRRLRDGITLRVNEVNQAGGIHGRTVTVVFMDDEYSPTKARENVKTFVKKYKSNLFLCNLGSPTTEFYKDLMEQQKIFVFFPSTGAPIFRQPSMKGLVHWRASFKSEGKALTRFIADRYGVKNFAFLYQNDSFGRGALEGAKEIVTTSTDVDYERNVASFKAQILQIKEAAPTAIGFFSTSVAATEFIRQIGVEFFIGKKVFGLSDLAEESFTKFAHSRGLDMITAQFSPNPTKSTLEIAQEFRKVLQQQGGAAGDVFMFEGYISASLAFTILQESKDLTPEGINTILDTLTQDSYKGLPLSFDAKTRELMQLLWIDTGEPTWIQQELS